MPAPADSTILVVEDEPLIGLDIESILGGLGVGVLLAGTLAAARNHVHSGIRLDGAFLDVRLPDGDVFGLARELDAAGVRIVFLTGFAQGIPRCLKLFAPEPNIRSYYQYFFCHSSTSVKFLVTAPIDEL